MNAIYRGKLYRLGDNMQHVELIDDVEADGKETVISVRWSDPELIVDPTDDEINNLLPDHTEP